MTVPCGCCPISVGGCFVANTEVMFQSATVSANPGGLSISNLASTIDGTQGSDLSGFVPPVSEATLTSNATTFDYTFAAPVNDLVRLRWHNGGGGILTDQDGFGLISVQFLDNALAPIGAMVPWDVGPPVGNNVPYRELNFGPLAGVKAIRFGDFHKQNPATFGTGTPLLRQVEAFTSTYREVYACRTATGAVQWYDADGNLVSTADVTPC